MRVTQGTFSFLPDLTDEQIEAQIRYALRNGWAISVEYTDDPHPRNALLGDVGPAALRPDRGRGSTIVLREVRAAREAFPDALRQGDRLRPRRCGRQTTALASSSTARRSSRASLERTGGGRTIASADPGEHAVDASHAPADAAGADER